MNDDDPLDLTQVAADAEALDALTAGRRTGDTPGDPALAALHELLRDVDRDLPEEVPLVPGLGSSVRAVSGERAGPRRLVRKGSMVALLAAGVISVGGVAAASSVAPDGSPLHDLREAVRSAAGAVVTAVTPPESRSSPEARPTPASTAAPVATTAPGAAVSAAVRSAAAARQVAALLDAAQALLADSRYAAAGQRLDTAERHLADVLPADGAAGLTARLTALRAQLAGATADPDEPRGGKPTDQPTSKATDKPGGKPSAKPAGRPSEPAHKRPAPPPDRKAEPTQKAEPEDNGDPEGNGDPEDEPAARETPGSGEEPPGQLSKDASAKPRA